MAAGLLHVSSRRPVEAPLLTRSSFQADRDIYVHLLSGAARHLESLSSFVHPPFLPFLTNNMNVNVHGTLMKLLMNS